MLRLGLRPGSNKSGTNALPARLEVYAIEGARFAEGADVTPAVGWAVERLTFALRAGGRPAAG